MWVHIIIFVVTAGAAIALKAGWLRLEGLEDPEGKRLFIAAALAGNILGLFVTLNSGEGQVYSNGHALKKKEELSYEEEFLVSVDGEDAGSIDVQVPEKETGGGADASAEEKPDPEEERERAIQDALALYNQEHGDPDYYYLPPEWEGHHLDWKEPDDHSGVLLAFLGLFAAAVLLVKRDREKEEARVRRMEQLLMDYPGLIMKFTLLVQAGMTVRRAFQKMASDYRNRNTGKKRFAYEELLVTCREMESGVSEREAYRRFGERCGQIKYKTFATLLVQNLQKGSRRLEDMLEKESMEAWDERKRRARVLGETAAMKLLFPMVLMLGVVMAIIMIPAFLSFYG